MDRFNEAPQSTIIHLNEFTDLLRIELKDSRKDNHFRTFHVSDFHEFWLLTRCGGGREKDYPLELSLDTWMNRFQTFLRVKSEKV